MSSTNILAFAILKYDYDTSKNSVFVHLDKIYEIA